VLNVAMPEIILNEPRVCALIGEREWAKQKEKDLQYFRMLHG
jgi:hypothetical protein